MEPVGVDCYKLATVLAYPVYVHSLFNDSRSWVVVLWNDVTPFFFRMWIIAVAPVAPSNMPSSTSDSFTIMLSCLVCSCALNGLWLIPRI